MFTKFFKKKQVPRIIKLRTIPPHVSFKVECSEYALTGYSGFDLTNPEKTSIGYAVCPACKRPYNVRVKLTDDVGRVIKAGSRHVFTINNINRQEIKREF